MSKKIYYESSYLAHYGVPHGEGPTKRGSGRWAFGSGGNTPNSRKEKMNKMFDRNIRQGKNKESASPAEMITRNAKSSLDSTKDVVNNSISLRNRILRKKATKNIDLSKKSDEEMRKYINRIDLERRYIDAITPYNKNQGLEYVGDIIGIVGGLAGIATSAAIIATVIKNK